MTHVISPLDLDLITTLTCRVRILAISQLRNIWRISNRSRRTFGRRLQRLAKAGLIELHTINAHLLNPTRPLFAWQPGCSQPDPVSISCAARARWRFAATPTLVCTASAFSANLHGSTARGLPKPEHRDHDLLLASVYTRYRTKRADVARFWVGEHLLPKAGYRIKDPDAFFCNERGDVLGVIESSGSYSPKQVERFHEHCVEHELPYELW